MEKCTSAGILPGYPDRVAFVDQRGIGQVFRHAPVQRDFSIGHLSTVFHDFYNPPVQLKPFRHVLYLIRQLAQGFVGHAGFDLFIPFGAYVRRPVHCVRIFDVLQEIVRNHFAIVQLLAVVRHHLFGLIGRNDAFGDKSLRIEFTGGPRSGYCFIHQWLGYAGFIGFVVSVATVTIDIDDHVLSELHAVIQGQPGNKQNRIGVVAIDVKYGRLHHFGHFGAIQRRT